MKVWLKRHIDGPILEERFWRQASPGLREGIFYKNGNPLNITNNSYLDDVEPFNDPQMFKDFLIQYEKIKKGNYSGG